MDDFRDDGTRVCPIHGLRFDPELSDGCIKCGKPSMAPKKKSTAPRGSVSKPASNAPPSHRSPSYAPPLARSSMTPPVPFDPMDIPTAPFSPSPFNQGNQGHYGQNTGVGQSVPLGGPITLLPTPERKQSRRGLILGLSAVVLGGAGAAAWFLGPDAVIDWKKKVTEFKYGPADAHGGALFIPTVGLDSPRPLLLLVDPNQHPLTLCQRFARQCETHGWVAIASDAFGHGVHPDDGANAAALLDEARARAKIDAGRPIVSGFDIAGEVACRLALVQPDVFGGAIMECAGNGPWRDVGALAQNDVSFFLFARTSDLNREKMSTMKDEMERKGLHVTWSELPGGHDPMERDELDPAFAWLEALRA
jgi:hypothetical protein